MCDEYLRPKQGPPPQGHQQGPQHAYAEGLQHPHPAGPTSKMDPGPLCIRLPNMGSSGVREPCPCSSSRALAGWGQAGARW